MINDKLIEQFEILAQKMRDLTPEEGDELANHLQTLYKIQHDLSQFDILVEKVKLKIGTERTRHGDRD